MFYMKRNFLSRQDIELTNEIMTITKGHNYVVNLPKSTPNNPNLDLLNVNACAWFDLIPSIRSCETERKRNYDDNKGP